MINQTKEHLKNYFLLDILYGYMIFFGILFFSNQSIFNNISNSFILINFFLLPHIYIGIKNVLTDYVHDRLSLEICLLGIILTLMNLFIYLI